MRPNDEKKRARIDGLKANPTHELADLWFENDPRAKYALLTILFAGENLIEIRVPYAKACILAILQEVYDMDNERNQKPETLRGRRRRGMLGQRYMEMHIHAVPLAESTVTHYLTDIQRAIRDALGFPTCEKMPDFLFERGNPWGVRIRPPGIVVHRERPDSDAPGNQ